MDVIALVIVAIFAIIVAVYLQNRSRDKHRLASAVDKFPGPPAYPFFGTSFPLLFVKREDIFDFFRGRLKTYYPIFRSWLGSYPNVHLMTAEHIEVVLSNSVNIDKGIAYNTLRPWLGDGLLTSTGSKWHRHRKLLTPAFHFKILENFVDVFTEKSKILTEHLGRKADGKAFDIFPYITKCALDIICKTAMGIEINAMSGENNEYVDAVYGISEEAVQKTNKPWLHWDFIYYWTDHGRKFKKYLSILHNMTNKVINERRQILQATKPKGDDVKDDDEAFGGKRRTAFLDLLLEASQNGKVLSQEQIREEVDTFLFEGHDTTTAGICWTLFLLGRHQDVQEEVYQEIVNTLPEAENPTLADLGELKLLERVVKESLRLYPSVSIIGRRVTTDINIDGRLIPAGCGVTVHIFEVHRNPKYFPNPEKFDPDRFLSENSSNRHPYAFIPFSAGPRNCIGQKFAMYEEKTVLAYILRRFKIKSLQTEETVRPVAELILRPFNGLLITLQARS